MTARKYKPGKPITSMGALDKWLQAGGWVYLRGRPKHPGFIVGMTFMTLKKFIQGKNLLRAKPC